MRMRSLWFLALVGGVSGGFLFGVVHVANADYICRADVSYKWTKKGAPLTQPPPALTSGPTPSAVADAPSAGAESETTVRYASIERRAADEPAAKASLLLEVNRSKVRASEACKRDHENMAGCVASKFNIQSSTLASLSFSARRELEKAVASDCQAQLGSCITAISSEPACEEVKVVEAAASPSPAAAEKKKK